MTILSIVEPVAILLVVETANGATIPFRWPANPKEDLRRRRHARREPGSGDISSDGSDGDGSDSEENDSYIQTVVDLQAPPRLRSSSKDTINARTSSRSSSIRPSHSRQHRPNILSGLPSGVISPATTLTPLPSAHPSGFSALHASPPDDSAEWNPDEYTRYLGFGALNLAKVLTPSKELCQQRFELVCDDYTFLGHPMRAPGPNRKWDVEDEARRERGRQKGPPRAGPADTTTSTSTGSNLEDVQEITSPVRTSALGLSKGPVVPLSTMSASANKSSEEDISLFHLVVVTEQTEGSLLDGSMTETQRLEALYKEVIFKVTAALFEAQTTDDWISRQARDLTNMRDSAKDARVPWSSFVESTITINPLAHALKTVYDTLLHYPFSSTIRIASLPLYIQLPLPPPPVDMDWAWWEDRISSDLSRAQDEQGYEDDGDEEAFWEDDVEDASTSRARGELGSASLKPWKALLLLDSEPSSRRESRIDQTWFPHSAPDFGLASSKGRGQSRTASMSTYNDLASANGSSRWKAASFFPATFTSSGTGTPLGTATPTFDHAQEAFDVEEIAEEERLPFYKLFMQHCKPSLSLRQISEKEEMVEAGVSLKHDIYPLARLLVWKRKARAIDPVKSGTHNVYFPKSSYGKDIPALIADFEHRFEALGALSTIFCQLAEAPAPFCQFDFLPSSAHLPHHASTRLHYDALIWLLRNDLVVGAPTRVMVFVREEVKVVARRFAAEDRLARLAAARHDAGDYEDEEGDEDEGTGGILLNEAETFERDTLDIEVEGTTLIEHPALAQGYLAQAWMRAVCEGKQAEEIVHFQRFFRYFDGKTSLTEMLYHERGSSRKHVNQVLKAFSQDLVSTNHP